VRARTRVVPEVAIILGTGLGGLADEVAVETRIPYGAIPGFPVATVESHAGELLVGTLAGRRWSRCGGGFTVMRGTRRSRSDYPSGCSSGSARGP